MFNLPASMGLTDILSLAIAAILDLKEECLNVGLGGIRDIKAEFRL